MARLPLELILEAVDAVTAGPFCRQVAYPASHPTTQTLLAFTRVCKATHTRAKRLLYQHCVYIDSQTRLRQLIRTIGGPDSSDEHSLSQNNSYLSIRALIDSLYLSPFPGPTIDDLPIAQWTFELLSMLQGTLRRLVVDINFCSLDHWDDHLNVRPTLRAAMEQLKNLEEFTSIRDALGWDVMTAYPTITWNPIWDRWPNLQKLSLYGITVNDWLRKGEFQMPAKLTHLVLNRPVTNTTIGFRKLLLVRNSQELRILVIDERAHDEHRKATYSEGYTIFGEKDEPSVEMIGVDVPVDIELGQNSDGATAKAFQEWVKGEAIEGTLWDLDGVFIGEKYSDRQRTPRLEVIYHQYQTSGVQIYL